MIVSARFTVLILLLWQWKAILLFSALAATATYVVIEWVPEVKMPIAPVTIVGSALGIFVSFRTNSAYARWWEGRQLWGRLINNSRTLCSQLLAYLPDHEEGRALANAIVRRHVGYVHALRVALRDQDLQDDPDLHAALTAAERASLAGESNPVYALAHATMLDVGRAAKKGWLDAPQLRAIDETLRAIVDVQGGCERIKRTPMPRGYAFIASRLILAFSLLLPLSLANDLGWYTIPVSVLVCLAFELIGETGRVLEDPFNMFWNALPLGALSKTIEINLRQRLGDTGLPGLPKPDARGVLM